MSELLQPQLSRPKSAGNLHGVRSITPTKLTQSRPSTGTLRQLDTLQKVKEHPLVLERERPSTEMTLMRRRSSSRPASSNDINIRMHTARPSSAPFSTFINVHADVVEDVVNRTRPNKSEVRPARKLSTENIHMTLFKMQKDKEDLEDKLYRLEAWQNSLKESGVYRNPKSALLGAILEANAREFPNSVANKLVTAEKEELEYQKEVRRSLRPSSSSGNFSSKRVNKNAQVKDFFREDDMEDVKAIKKIIRNQRPSTASLSKLNGDIRDKINNFLSQMKNYQNLMEANKELITQKEEKEASEGSDSRNHEYSIGDVSPIQLGDRISPKIAVTDYNLNLLNDHLNISSPTDRDLTSGRISQPRSGSTTPAGRVRVIHSRPASSRRSINSTPTLLPREMPVVNTFRTNLNPNEVVMFRAIQVSGSRAIMHDFKESRSKSLVKLRPPTFERTTHTTENLIKTENQSDLPTSGNEKAKRKNLSTPFLRLMSQKEEEMRRRLNSARREPYTYTNQQGVTQIHIDGNYLVTYSSNHQTQPSNGKKVVLKSWITHETNPLSVSQTLNQDDDLM